MQNIFSPKNKKAKILIIDDEEDICAFLKSKLERTGKFQAWATTSSSEGIVLAKQNHPDMILLDIMMPEMDGTEVAQALAKDAATKDILIVFFSILAETKEIERNDGTIGGRPFIPKNIAPNELIARIEALLEELHAIK